MLYACLIPAPHSYFRSFLWRHGFQRLASHTCFCIHDNQMEHSFLLYFSQHGSPSICDAVLTGHILHLQVCAHRTKYCKPMRSLDWQNGIHQTNWNSLTMDVFICDIIDYSPKDLIIHAYRGFCDDNSMLHSWARTGVWIQEQTFDRSASNSSLCSVCRHHAAWSLDLSQVLQCEP